MDFCYGKKGMPWPSQAVLSTGFGKTFLLSPFAALETDRNYSIVLVVSPPNGLITGPGD